MKLRLTYLLFLCLFFFKGYSCVSSAVHKNSSDHSAAQNFENSNTDELFSQQILDVQFQDILFIEDAEDNDTGWSRKRGSFNSSCSMNDHIIFPNRPPHYFKKSQLPRSHFFSPDKNIFLRVMKL